MPVPATTGVLRTTVASMLIGDYIACGYSAISGAVGTFSNLAGPSAEIPLPAPAAPGGNFYFVKVEKGLLISDRVIQTSISWDTLNAGKYIQGLLWDNGNAIPTMTSDTTPSGISSASSNMANNQAYKAFDKALVSTTAGTFWQSNQPLVTSFPPWLAYDFSTPKIITKYVIHPFTNGTNSNPKNWTFEGWNGTAWVVLDTQTNITNWAAKNQFIFLNTVAYTKYRINISATNGDPNYVIIQELEMMETAGLMRSLTGGVAYADANGNKVTTPPTPWNGAWPTNNEYDKYIIHFDTTKIQAGKILDDVFHHGAFTCIQDTPVIAIGAAGYRGYRSGNTADLGNPSSGSFTSGGFRPVFEYKV